MEDMNLPKLESILVTIYVPVMVRELQATLGLVQPGRKVAGPTRGLRYEVTILFYHPLCERPLAALLAFEEWTFGRKPGVFARILDAEVRGATKDLIRHRDFYI